MFNTIEISFSALSKILIYQQKYINLPESGGILIGRVLEQSNNVIVDIVTEPCTFDRQKRFSFFRSNAHQNTLNEMWKKSNGTLNYLGEWHTHPEKDPTPSNIDFSNWYKKLKAKNIESTHLYFIIIGTEQIGVWQGNTTKLTIQKMLLYGKKQTTE